MTDKGMSTGVKILMGVLVLLVCLGFILFGLSMGGVIGGDSAGASAATPPAVVVADARSTLLSTGKILLAPETDITTSVSMGNAGVDSTKPVAYTISMFLNVEKTAPGWRNIFFRGADDGNRHPGIYIVPGKLTFHFRHADTVWNNSGIDQTTGSVTAGQYNHLAFVNDGSNMYVYINGIKDAAVFTHPPGASFLWGNNDSVVSVINDGYKNNSVGYVKVKEVSWFNKALSESEIGILKSSPTSTTSTYKRETSSIKPFNEED